MYTHRLNKPLNEPKAVTMLFQSNENVIKRQATVRIARMALAASLIAWTSVGMTAQQDASFVDSVYDWGFWELGLEPAAGGPAAPKTTAVKINQRKLQFRPNDNSAFRGKPAMITSDINPAPVAPPLPATPPTPTAAPPGALPGGGSPR